MADVCVITGGGSGIGLAAAGYMPQSKVLLLVGRTESKLQAALELLRPMGFTVHYRVCDIADRTQVQALAQYASSLGTVRQVIHAAGMSPSMTLGDKLLQVNALGTVYVNTCLADVMAEGGVIVDVASSAAYSLPAVLAKVLRKYYPLAEADPAQFVRRMMHYAKMGTTEYEKAGFAYAISKSFVVWYAQKCAFDYAARGIRVCSLSPGLVNTDMGRLEEANARHMVVRSASQRMGTAAEVGFALATAVDERNGYLAGVDILCDGGATNGKYFPRH